MGRPVVHWEIGGHDLDRLTAFYRALFGWDITSADSEYRIAETGDGVGGGLMRCRPGMSPYVTLYVSVDDVDAALATAHALGGRPLVSPSPIPGVGSFALFADPEGNAIGLLQMAARRGSTHPGEPAGAGRAAREGAA